MNTSTVIAVALAIIVVIGAFTVGPSLFAKLNQPNTPPPTGGTTATTTATSTTAAAAPVTSSSGLSVTDNVVGTGAVAKPGDSVSVQYVGTLSDGTVFDSTQAHGGQPFTFTLGAGQVIQGWDEGVAGMRVGGTRTLVIPPALGYGDHQVGPIPPNSTLTFKVTLVKVTPPAK